MRKITLLLAVLILALTIFSCEGEPGKNKGKEINYTIARSLNVDYRAWAKLELTEDQNPKARLTFHGTTERYFNSKQQVTGEGTISGLPEKGLTVYDINFEGTKVQNSGCDKNLNYRLTLVDGGTIDNSRGALVVFCGDPEPKNELYVYRVRGNAIGIILSEK